MSNFIKHVLSIITFLSSILSYSNAQTTEELQREFTELRFGMFIHFSIMTFTGASWATPNQDVSQFNPADLDVGQWANAMVSAKMKFAILTTKHHDGFCLWDSELTENDVASSPWKNGQGDIVREFVDTMRARSLEPCLYYSVWDNTEGVGNGSITVSDIEFIKGQLTELLSDYGEIKMLFIDGWSWKMGHKNVPYDEIRALVKELQPGCLLVDNTHLRCLYNNDLLHYEDGSPYPSNNTFPGIFSLKINRNSGNDWFWDSSVPTANLLSVNEIVNNNLNLLEPQWVTFILNCPPNQEGKLDNNIVNQLAEVGQSWNPDTNRLLLPPQLPQIEQPITPVSASSNSGNASNVIDGFNDRFNYTVWQTSASLPQSITIDLGEEYDGVSILAYVPKYEPYINPLTEGSIKSYKIYKSTDNTDFIEIAGGEWNGDINMKVVTFTPTNARYIRLEALTAINDFAAATEIAIGRGENSTNLNPQGIIYPDEFLLEQNYPNPFNPKTLISYQLSEPGQVLLEVYNVLGQKVNTLVDNYFPAGAFSVQWLAQDEFDKEVPSSIYFYRLQVESENRNFSDVKKMILLR
jgi:alpha-L-fucosidase